jgi:ABC-type glycerol-3-phosphate transport system substrate-binding protein
MRSILSRRDLLKAGAVLAGASALAACGATPAPAATTAPTQAPAATSAPAATTAPEATAAPTSAPAATTAPEATVAATSAPAAAGGKAITLRYRSWHSPEGAPRDKAWYDWLTENYPKDHPNVTIAYEFVPWGNDYIQKVLADSAAGTPPELLHSSIVWARDFYDRGVLMDLNDYIDKVPELAEDQFLGAATTQYRSKAGKFYGVPWEGPDSSCIAINSKLFKDAGFDPKGADIKTWADFDKVAKALTKGSGADMTQAGFLVDSMRYIEGFATWLYSDGGACSDPEFTKPTFNDSKGAEVVQHNLDLLNKDQVSFPISPERQDSQLFMQGKVGMVYWGTWAPAEIEGNAPEGFEWWLIPVPQGPQGSGPATTCWSNMFVMPKKGKEHDATFELMRYCTTPPVVITRFELSTRTTPHKAIFESDAWKKVLEKTPQRVVTPDFAKLGGIYPFFPFFTEANDALGTVLEQIMGGQKGVKDGLAEAETKVADVMTRRKSAATG